MSLPNDEIANKIKEKSFHELRSQLLRELFLEGFVPGQMPPFHYQNFDAAIKLWNELNESKVETKLTLPLPTKEEYAAALSAFGIFKGSQAKPEAPASQQHKVPTLGRTKEE